MHFCGVDKNSQGIAWECPPHRSRGWRALRGKAPLRGPYPEPSPSSVSRFRFFLRVILARRLKSLSLFLSPPSETSPFRECDLGHPSPGPVGSVLRLPELAHEPLECAQLRRRSLYRSIFRGLLRGSGRVFLDWISINGHAHQSHKTRFWTRQRPLSGPLPGVFDYG